MLAAGAQPDAGIAGTANDRTISHPITISVCKERSGRDRSGIGTSAYAKATMEKNLGYLVGSDGLRL